MTVSIDQLLGVGLGPSEEVATSTTNNAKNHLVDRAKYIGGSDMPCIIAGRHYDKTREDLASYKAGLKELESMESPILDFGNNWEAPIRDWYKEQTGFEYPEAGYVIEEPRDNIIGIRINVDGFNASNPVTLIEIKTASKQELKESYKQQVGAYLWALKHHGVITPEQFAMGAIVIVAEKKQGIEQIDLEPSVDNLKQAFQSIKAYHVTIDADYEEHIVSNIRAFQTLVAELKAAGDMASLINYSLTKQEQVFNLLVRIEADTAKLKEIKASIKEAMIDNSLKKVEWSGVRARINADTEVYNVHWAEVDDELRAKYTQITEYIDIEEFKKHSSPEVIAYWVKQDLAYDDKEFIKENKDHPAISVIDTKPGAFTLSLANKDAEAIEEVSALYKAKKAEAKALKKPRGKK